MLLNLQISHMLNFIHTKFTMITERRPHQPAQLAFMRVFCILDELELRYFCFCGAKKTGPGEKPSEQGENQQHTADIYGLKTCATDISERTLVRIPSKTKN